MSVPRSPPCRSWLRRWWAPPSQSPGSGPGSSARNRRARTKCRNWISLTARRTPSSWRCWSLAWFGEFIQGAFKGMFVSMCCVCLCVYQIDDTDAVEDIHALLTDAPTPNGWAYWVFIFYFATLSAAFVTHLLNFSWFCFLILKGFYCCNTETMPGIHSWTSAVQVGFLQCFFPLHNSRTYQKKYCLPI